MAENSDVFRRYAMRYRSAEFNRRILTELDGTIAAMQAAINGIMQRRDDILKILAVAEYMLEDIESDFLDVDGQAKTVSVAGMDYLVEWDGKSVTIQPVNGAGVSKIGGEGDHESGQRD